MRIKLRVGIWVGVIMRILFVSFKEDLLIGSIFKVTKYCLLNLTRKIATLFLIWCWNCVQLVILSMFISTLNCSFHLISPLGLQKWDDCYIFPIRAILSPAYSLMEVDDWFQVLKIDDYSNNDVKIPFLTTTSLLSQWSWAQKP